MEPRGGGIVTQIMLIPLFLLMRNCGGLFEWKHAEITQSFIIDVLLAISIAQPRSRHNIPTNSYFLSTTIFPRNFLRMMSKKVEKIKINKKWKDSCVRKPPIQSMLVTPSFLFHRQWRPNRAEWWRMMMMTVPDSNNILFFLPPPFSWLYFLKIASLTFPSFPFSVSQSIAYFLRESQPIENKKFLESPEIFLQHSKSEERVNPSKNLRSFHFQSA